MSKKYAYFTGTEYLSGEFDSIEGALQESVASNDIHWFKVEKDSKGEYVVIEIAETEEYEDRIAGEDIIEALVNDAYWSMGDIAEDYLYKVDIDDFNKEINKFWKQYKKKNNIGCLYRSIAGTRKVYKAYFVTKDEREYLVNYEEVVNGEMGM